MQGTQNFGEQEMKGLEIEFDYLPYEGGRVSGWITTMDTEVTEDFNTQWYYGQDAYLGRSGYDASVANVPENYVNLKGNEAPYSPNLAFTIKYEHTFNLGTMGQHHEEGEKDSSMHENNFVYISGISPKARSSMVSWSFCWRYSSAHACWLR